VALDRRADLDVAEARLRMVGGDAEGDQHARRGDGGRRIASERFQQELNM
jgi:hypothetical protein